MCIRDRFRTELHAQAEQKLRGSLGRLMVAEREHLWPTDAEVEAALAHWKGERTFPCLLYTSLFSNEAGSGSAPCAAAAASCDDPVKMGFVQAQMCIRDRNGIQPALG